MKASSLDRGNRLDPEVDAKINRCLQSLNSLKEGEEAVAKLIACGRSAIEPLRRFLLGGPPSVVYHPRRWAVEALAGLGAKEVLLEYLKQKKDIADPAVRLGEEAVESAAARELVRWPSEETFGVLLEIAQERCLPGVLEALGEFRRPEAVPFLVKALEDDVCRRAAEEALRKIGSAADPDLIRTAVTPRPSRKGERPSSLLRRRSAVRLLAERGIRKDEWPLLHSLLKDRDAEIRIATFRMAARSAGTKDRALATRHLLEAVPHADWFIRNEIEKVLIDWFEYIGHLVEEEIVRRKEDPKGYYPSDPILMTLLQVKRRADRKESASICGSD